MELTEIRKRINEINNDITVLFKERMDLSLEVAKYKKLNNLPVMDSCRENEILKSVKEKCGEEYGDYATELFSLIFKLSRDYQESYLSQSFDYGLIGEKLGHSCSREIHKLIAPYDYRLINIPKDEIGDFLTKRHFKGLNVTIPYKQTVIPYCDEITDRARKIGAVNTLSIEKGTKMVGDNTDYMGFSYLLSKNRIDVKNKQILVLGTGGASLTVSAVLTDRGAKEVIKISRNGEYNYSNLSQFENADILVNTSPCGMYPANGECLVDLTKFKKLFAVIDIIYNPLKTELMQRAQELSIPSFNGLSMLVAQAKYAAEIFTKKPIDDSILEKVTRETEKNLTNLVLIGMPGCGKTSLGKLVAQSLNRDFFDCNEAIEKETGLSVSQIFEKKGETAFRQLEEDIVREYSKKTGVVIALGGGTLNNHQNVRRLACNGKFCLVDRNVHLLETKNRPLIKNFEELCLMEKQRQPIYLGTADFTARNADLELCCEIIVSEFNALFSDKE